MYEDDDIDYTPVCDCFDDEKLNNLITENDSEIEDLWEKMKTLLEPKIIESIKDEYADRINENLRVDRMYYTLIQQNRALKNKIAELESIINKNSHINKMRNIINYSREWEIVKQPCPQCNGKKHLKVIDDNEECHEIICPYCKGLGYVKEDAYFIQATVIPTYYIRGFWYFQDEFNNYKNFDPESYEYNLNLSELIEGLDNGVSFFDVERTYKKLKDFFDERNYLEKPQWLLDEEKRRATEDGNGQN